MDHVWRIVNEMLGRDPGAALPDKIVHRLKRMNALAEKCGGGIRSRQIIAMVVDDYLMDLLKVKD